MTITAISHAATAIETITAYGTRLYMMASEIFTISAILWCLNFMANMIEKTYTAGKTVGAFYFEYLHEYMCKAVYAVGVMSTVAIAFIATQAVRVYENRKEIISSLNDIREYISYQFIYVSPVVE